MSTQLQSFLAQEKRTLQVFCPSAEVVIATFENHLPHRVVKIEPDVRPDLPTELPWCRMGYDYYAYLPKERAFGGHLLAPLKHHKPTHVQRDGRWYADERTVELWRSIDLKLAYSIDVVGRPLWVELDHYSPPPATKYGFTRGHKSIEALTKALQISRHAFVHRLAYLTYLISLRYQWDVSDLCDHVWWTQLSTACGRNWVDSVWASICSQQATRNFIGIAVKPIGASVKWLRSALNFGVPIWVAFNEPGCYRSLDGSFVMKYWEPTDEQVFAARAQAAATHTKSAFVFVPPQPPADSNSLSEARTDAPQIGPFPLSPPATLPPNAQWFESWKDFFLKRDEKHRQEVEAASDEVKRGWDSRAENAKKFHAPGKGGAKVYEWESCDSGGFFRILQTRAEAADSWEHYYKEALVFSPKHNTWDYCPFMWGPAVENGSPDDEDDEDGGQVMECWYAEPDVPVTLPEDTLSPLEFLYRRYGFLAVEPTTPPETILPFDRATAHRIVGLEVQDSGERLDHLNSFITSILQGQVPAGHCDLSSSAPTNEMLPPSSRTSITNTVFQSGFPELSDGPIFTLVNSANDLQLLLVHDPLSVLQMVRAETQSQLDSQVQHLLRNGCRFTLLYPHTRSLDTPRFDILTFPLRDRNWKATTEDYKAYMSRLKTFFLERPYVAAAAYSRGGIAWRIVREVLGIEGSADAVLSYYPDQGSSVQTPRGLYWFHGLDEGEWFYLVGGYELATGL